MRILKLEIEKKDKSTFLNVELDITGETSGYSVQIFNHINKKNKIDITDQFEEDKSIAKASVNLKELGIHNTTVVVMEIEDSKFEIHKGLVTDISNYFKCIMREIMKEIDEKCDECLIKHNETLTQLAVSITAFKDAYTIGAVDELLQLANMIDKMCNSNCTDCGGNNRT